MDNIANMDSHTMFEQIKSGKIALEDFLDWVERTEEKAWQQGQEQGSDTAFESRLRR